MGKTIFVKPPVATLQISFIPSIPYHSNSLCSSNQLADFIRSCYDPNTLQYAESFYCLYLNRANKVLAVAEISKGGMTGTVVDIRTIIALALQSAAVSIIISHNHPSSNLRTSVADEKITKEIKQAVAFFQIHLLDHIIITADSYLSFADEGLL